MKNVEIADLHIHSRYSRATSRDGNPEMLAYQAARKGIRYLGTGDFTHPAWREELKEKLEPAEPGLYRLKKEYRISGTEVPGQQEPRFVVSGEISSIYKKNGKTRKVHSLILLPGLAEAEELSKRLEAIGNIHSDGRPILGLPCRDLLEITLETCPEAMFIPAHIWTPHFSLFGAFSGFDTMEECFEELTPYIHAVETGLSSDPPMNWTLSALDGLQLISNSDAHSPGKLGREANLLEIDCSYEGLYNAVQKGEGLAGTIEFFPEEGKYHFDGHRKCHLVLSPAEAEAAGNICPVCGKKLTMGVSHRILQLSDRKEGYVRENARPFQSLAPLPEVIGASTGHAASGKRVQAESEKLLAHLGTEFSILREIPLEDIRKEAGERVAEGIRRLRAGAVIREPGYDGQYGKIRLFTEEELENTEGQLSFSFASPAAIAGREGAAGRKKEQPKAEEKGREEKTREESLNPEQEKAVRSESRRLAVIAGPGTGKTKTLVSRILYLIREKQVKPREITAVTFTRKAAAELEERLEKALGGKRHLKGMQIGTFHSVAIKALRDAGIETRLAENLECRELAGETRAAFHLSCSGGRLLGEISRIKSGRESALIPEEVYAYYQKLLEERGLLDFDDLLLAAAEYFERPDSDRSHFSYLLVDEFQDINPVQYRLTEAWNREGKSLFVIGDPDQSIYGFRGSQAACFQDLLRDHPEMEVIRLRTNYRSTPEILGAAAAVIRHNPGGERELEPALPSGCPVDGPGKRRIVRGHFRCPGDQPPGRRRRYAGGSGAGSGPGEKAPPGIRGDRRSVQDPPADGSAGKDLEPGRNPLCGRRPGKLSGRSQGPGHLRLFPVSGSGRGDRPEDGGGTSAGTGGEPDDRNPVRRTGGNLPAPDAEGTARKDPGSVDGGTAASGKYSHAAAAGRGGALRKNGGIPAKSFFRGGRRSAALRRQNISGGRGPSDDSPRLQGPGISGGDPPRGEPWPAAAGDRKGACGYRGRAAALLCGHDPGQRGADPYRSRGTFRVLEGSA